MGENLIGKRYADLDVAREQQCQKAGMCMKPPGRSRTLFNQSEKYWGLSVCVRVRRGLNGLPFLAEIMHPGHLVAA